MPHAVPTVKGAPAPVPSPVPGQLLVLVHQRHGPRLLRLALRLSAGHRPDAEELVQSAYERALAAPERFALALPEAAALRLADAVRERARSLRRRAARELPDDLERLAGPEEPHALLERAEERDLLLAALAELRPAERRTLALIGAGYRQAEVARALSVSEACVAKTAERGRASLAEGRRALAAGERCRRMERLAPAYLAGTLALERRRALERHLHSCRAACPRTFARLRAERARGPLPDGALAA